MRRPCPCGRVIYLIQRRWVGAGLAKFWVALDNPTWQHPDGTEACQAPAVTRIRKRACSGQAEAGHLGALEQYVWVVFLLAFFVLLVRLVGVAW